MEDTELFVMITRISRELYIFQIETRIIVEYFHEFRWKINIENIYCIDLLKEGYSFNRDKETKQVSDLIHG